MKEYVLGFLFSYGFGEVVLIRKNKPEWQAGKLNGLGGSIEPADKSPLSAMRREFKEECGADIDNWGKFATMEGPGWRVDCFVAFRSRAYLYATVCTATEEKVGVYEPETFYDLDKEAFSTEELLPNVFWLMSMAREFITGKQPALTILYPHEQ